MSREVKEYFEQVSPRWDELRQGFYGEEVRDAVLASAQILSEHTVLDVGAGTGFLTIEAARRARRVIALDLSESMLEEAKAKLEGGNVEFRIGCAEEIPLPDSSVDVVIGNMVLHHCPRPAVAVNEMSRVLVPGGRLALSDMQEHSYESLRVEHADLWLGFRTANIKGILEQAGLEAVYVSTLSLCCSETRLEGQIKIPMFLGTGRKPW